MAAQSEELGLGSEVDQLAACCEPLLIGVRHHSAALSRVMVRLLEAFNPDVVLVEMPRNFADWMPYLADPQTVAPVAISAVDQDGQLAFYPLADFSPELVAIRWAHRNGVRLVPCDLAVGARSNEGASFQQVKDNSRGSPYSGLLDALLQRTQSCDTGQLWERLVESASMVSGAEMVRRAGLTFGWAVRASAEEVSSKDLLREAVMRQTLREHPGRAAAVVGAGEGRGPRYFGRQIKSHIFISVHS